jgi:hypothetical protein
MTKSFQGKGRHGECHDHTSTKVMALADVIMVSICHRRAGLFASATATPMQPEQVGDEDESHGL